MKVSGKQKAEGVLSVDLDQAEQLALASRWAGYMLGIAEASDHPDAKAAARWLEAVGERAWQLSSVEALRAAHALNGGWH